MSRPVRGGLAPLSGRTTTIRQVVNRVAALFLLFLTSVVTLSAQDVTRVFVAPPQPLIAGSQASVWLYCLNNSSQPVSQNFEPSLSGQLVSGYSTNWVALALNRPNPSAEIAPGGFVRVEYQFALPAALQGQASLDVSNYNQLLISVAAGATDATAMAQPGSPPPQNPPTGKPAVTTTTSEESNFLGDISANHLLPYEPVFFILGTYPAAKFQYSLKFRLLTYADDRYPWNNLYFAYTQTSFWDLLTKDPSFYDTSYKPSAFLYYHDVLPHQFPIRLDLQSGVEHESNGRGGSGERSLYTVYLQPTFTYAVTTNLTFMLQPRARYYLSLSDNNPDLAQYRGYADLLAAVTWQDKSRPWEKIQLSSKILVGDEGSHPSVTVDLRFNLPRCLGFNPAIQAEYFYGYGQTLRQYNQLSQGLRAGLCLWY